VLGDPNRNFQVTANDGITEAELFIINRQGTLVHYQKTEETPVGSPFFEWDGKSNGSYITPGTYVVILIGRNPAYQFEEKITGSLLVLE
jgi:flagellar hook assembly protein FlgD